MKYILILCFLFSSLTQAANTSSSAALDIRAIYYFSKQESIYPDYKGLVQIYFEGDISWTNNGTCSGSSVVVRNEDAHLLSAILAAKMSSSPIRVYADDSLKLAGQCYLRALGM